jgi:uncharacterized protein (TIGR00251 family)
MKIVSIKVKPNSRVSILEDLGDGAWLARVKAPPADGKANEELLRLVARHFDLRRAQVSIKRGTSGRLKRVQLDD